MKVRGLLAIMALVLAVQVPLTGPADATTPRTSSTSPFGYWLITGWGTSYAFDAPYMGDPAAYGSDQCVNSGPAPKPNYSCVAVSAAPDGTGYWIANGAVQHGGCPGDPQCSGFYGSASPFGVGVPTGSGPVQVDDSAAPIVGASAAPVGVWIVASDGGVFALHGASFLGSIGGRQLNKPVVGMAATPDGKGYWEVASDGGVFAFGDAAFYGSMGSKTLNKPVVGMAATPDGKGYWEVASDGGVFAFGDAPFLGTAVGQALDAPIVGIAALVPGSSPIPNPICPCT